MQELPVVRSRKLWEPNMIPLGLFLNPQKLFLKILSLCNIFVTRLFYSSLSNELLGTWPLNIWLITLRFMWWKKTSCSAFSNDSSSRVLFKRFLPMLIQNLMSYNKGKAAFQKYFKCCSLILLAKLDDIVAEGLPSVYTQNETILTNSKLVRGLSTADHQPIDGR